MISYKRALNIFSLRSKSAFSILDFVPVNDSYFFATSVRNGIEACINILGTTKNDAVLLPAFVAQGVITPFQKKGINILYYKSGADLKFDADNIKKRIAGNKSIKYIVIIHYFGFPQRIAEIKSFCNEHGVIVFEDCAQALFSKSDDGKLLGSTGDIAFFSLPKTLPVPDGSIFIVNNDKYKHLPGKIISSYKFSIAHVLAVSFHFCFLVIKNFEVKLNYSIIYKLLNYTTSALYALYYFFLRRINRPVNISKRSLKILGKINYKELIENRKNNIARIYETINRSRYHLMNPAYHSNYVLTGVPLISSQRNAVVKMLKKKKNIECLCYLKGWYFFPDDLSEFRNEIDVYNTHYLLPVKEDMDIKYLTEVVSENH